MPRSIRHPDRRTIASGIAIVAATTLAFGARAQITDDFTPVDQTVADVSPLGASLQSLRPDFGPPQGFGRVYTHPDYPGKFVRVDGAIVVEFAQSEYVETEDGLFVPLPEGAIFWIGGKPDYLKPQRQLEADAVQSRYFVNARLDARAATLDERAAAQRQAQRAAEPPTRPTVWSDENYRRSRLQRWLNVAAEMDKL